MGKKVGLNRIKLSAFVLFCFMCTYGFLPISQHILPAIQTQETGLIVLTTIDEPTLEVVRELWKQTDYRWFLRYAYDAEMMKIVITEFSGAYVTIVGHGSPEGLLLKTGVLSWKTIGSMFDDSSADFFFTAACYSANIDQYSEKQTFGYLTLVDSYVAAQELVTTASLASHELRKIKTPQSPKEDSLYVSRRRQPRAAFILTATYYYTIKVAATDGLADHLESPWYEGGMGWGSNWAEDLEAFVEESLDIFETNFDIEFDVIEVFEFDTDSTTHHDVMQDAYGSIWNRYNCKGNMYDILLVYLTDRLAAGDSNYYDGDYAIAASFHHPWAAPDEWPHTLGDKDVLRHEFSHIFEAWHDGDGDIPQDWYYEAANPHHPPYFYEHDGQNWIYSLMDYLDCYAIDHARPDWDDHNYQTILDHADWGVQNDPDDDDLTNQEEWQYQTLPYNPDTDDDDMPDGWEATYYPTVLPTVFDPDEDPDNDWLDNYEEYQQGTDPTDPDSDNDGILDGDEVFIWNTEPMNWDSDGDEMSDGWEISYYPTLNPTQFDANSDPDADNYTNLEEYFLGSNPTIKNAIVSPGSLILYSSTSVLTIMHFDVNFAYTYQIKIEYKINGGSWVTDRYYTAYFSVGSHYRDEHLYTRPSYGHTVYVRWTILNGAAEVVDQYQDSLYIPPKYPGGKLP